VILDGRQSAGLQLDDLLTGIPLDWQAQMARLNFTVDAMGKAIRFLAESEVDRACKRGGTRDVKAAQSARKFGADPKTYGSKPSIASKCPGAAEGFTR
jgi:hypothetical protein